MDPKEQSPTFFFWDGEENSTRLIENILPLLSKFSNVHDEKLKEMISTAVLTVIKEKYANFEFMIEFDENRIFHLKHDNYDFLPALSSGDRIVLWVSLLAAIIKSCTNNLTFILYRPFYRLDAMKSILLAKSLKDNFINGQVILLGPNREFKSIGGV
jgi:hypothetical protein